MKKTTKKITSVLLVLTMILSCFALVGCAGKLGYFKEKRIKEDYIEFFNITDKTADDVVLDYYAGNYEGYEIVMLDVEWHDPEEWIEVIGKMQINYKDSNRLLAWKDGEFFSLTDAYNTEKLSAESISDIGEVFNSKVQYFIDTCDIYDFDKTEYQKVEYDWSNNKDYNKLHILLDMRLFKDMDFESAVRVETMAEHLKYGELITDFKHLTIDSGSPILLLSVDLPYNNRLFRWYAVNELAKIPGVLMVSPFTIGGYGQS